MGVALPSLAILAEMQNSEARFLPGPFFFLSLFFLVAFGFFCFFFVAFSFSFLLNSVHETVEQGADHGMEAGLEDNAARAAKNNMGCSTARGQYMQGSSDTEGSG